MRTHGDTIGAVDCGTRLPSLQGRSHSVPALPLLMRVPEWIVGVLVVLLLALQVLTVLELVARRSLTDRQEQIAGLVPGNPTMKTARPPAERLLAACGNLHLLWYAPLVLAAGWLLHAVWDYFHHPRAHRSRHIDIRWPA